MSGAFPPANGLEMSRPASSSIVSQTRIAAAGRVGSIELLGSFAFCSLAFEVLPLIAQMVDRNDGEKRPEGGVDFVGDLDKGPGFGVWRDVLPGVCQVCHLLGDSPMDGGEEVRLLWARVVPGGRLGEEVFRHYVVWLGLGRVEEVEQDAGVDRE